MGLQRIGFIKTKPSIFHILTYLIDKNFTVNVRVFDFSEAYNLITQGILFTRSKAIYNHFHTYLMAKVLVK